MVFLSEPVGRMASSFSIAEAARELNVSQATVRNWFKTGAAGDGSMDSLRRLANERLTRRANKANALGHSVCDESLTARNRRRSGISENPILWKIIDGILAFHAREIQRSTEEESVGKSFVSQHSVLTELVLFLSVQQFIFSHFSANHESCPTLVAEELAEWERHLLEISKKGFSSVSKSFNLVQNDIFSKCASQIPLEIDFSGILYQELTRSGTKSRRGAFYTPSILTQEAVARLQHSSGFCLDPCCGSGAFLLAAQKYSGLPISSLWGMDLDPVAVRIARLNLLLNSPGEMEKPRIFCWDGLQENLPETFPKHFEIIATNPPWGAVSSDGKKEETFTRFLRRGWDLLKENGEAVFLLPESFLNIRRHAGTRRFLLKNARILEIKEQGRAFSDVFTPVVRIHFIKTGSENSELSEKSGFHQDVFLRTPENIISLRLTPEISRIVDKMFSVPHETLKDQAVWGLGIVTGNNVRWLRKITNSFPLSDHSESDEELDGLLITRSKGRKSRSIQEKNSLTNEENPEKRKMLKESSAWEPIIRGTDIKPYRILSPTTEINFQPEFFQQSLPESRYRVSEKIVYRFISSRPVFALDTEKRLTLNSANFLIPNIPGMSGKTLLAFLNSEAFHFLFRTLFFTRKVLRGDLEILPFPKISEKIAENLEILVGDIFSGKPVCAKIDEIVFSAFSLTRTEIQLVRRSLDSASERN